MQVPNFRSEAIPFASLRSSTGKLTRKRISRLDSIKFRRANQGSRDSPCSQPDRRRCSTRAERKRERLNQRGILRSLQPASLQHVSVTYRSFFKVILLIPCCLRLTTVALHHRAVALGLIVTRMSVNPNVRRRIVRAVSIILILNV